MPRFSKCNETYSKGYCSMCGRNLTNLEINKEYNGDHSIPKNFLDGKFSAGEPIQTYLCEWCDKPIRELEPEFCALMKFGGPNLKQRFKNSAYQSMLRGIGAKKGNLQKASSGAAKIVQPVCSRTIAGDETPEYFISKLPDMRKYNPVIRKMVDGLSIHHTGKFLTRSGSHFEILWDISPTADARTPFSVRKWGLQMTNQDYIGQNDELQYRWYTNPTNKLVQHWLLIIRKTWLIDVFVIPTLCK